MASWIQQSDFSSADITQLSNYDDFVIYIDSLDKDDLDALYRKLEESNDECCPWGIGINMDTNFGLHVTREDYNKNTYAVLVTETAKKKMLGFIPISKNEETSDETLSYNAMKQVVRGYYEKLNEK